MICQFAVLLQAKIFKSKLSFCSSEFVNLKKKNLRKWTYHYLVSVYEPSGCWIFPLFKYMRMNRQRNWIIILPKKKIILGQKSQNTVKKRRLHLIYEFHIFIQIQTRITSWILPGPLLSWQPTSFSSTSLPGDMKIFFIANIL